MNEFTSGFWSAYIAVLTIASILACGVLLWKLSTKRLAAGQNSSLKGLAEGDLVVPQDQWMKLATHQCIIIDATGKAHVMKIDPEQLAKTEDWVKWNLARDKTLPPH